MNVFTFTGRLGRDAEQRYAPSGAAVLSFVVANDVGFGERKTTNWVKCAIFGKRAEGALVQHLTKGTQVCVSGEVTLNEFDKRDGTRGAAMEVRVQELDLIGGKGESKPREQSEWMDPPAGMKQRSAPAPTAPEEFSDDIPFRALPGHAFV